MVYTEEDCINAIEEAYDILGYSPTTREYKELDLSPSVGTIKNKIGWDKAKSLAGLEKCDSSKKYPKPDCINMSDKKWDSLSTMRKRIWKKRVFVSKDKLSKGCQKCGFNKQARALDYHHTKDNKDRSISEMVNRGYSKENLLKEIEKCTVLCSNCHRIESHNTIDLTGWRP